MRPPRRIPVTVLFPLLVLALAAAVPAAEEPAEPEGQIPHYEAARLKVLQGPVWVRPPDSGEWEEYGTNMPLGERARVGVPRGSEAEIQFRGGQFLLVREGSEIDIRQLGEKKAAFALREGTIALSLPPEDFVPVRVHLSRETVVEIPVPGRYWVVAERETPPRVIVRSGEAEVAASGTSARATAGQEVVVDGGLKVQAARDGGQKEEEPRPQEMTEAERQAGIPPAAAAELRPHGEWLYTQEYGYVWKPRVDSDWAPYYYGSWAYAYPFGWNWVPYEPWGWWPSHYGWWTSYPAYGWVWCPYGSFVSVGFGFGYGFYGYPYYGHYGYPYYGYPYYGYPYYRYNAYYRPATVRYVHDGRSVRWVPLRPGETAASAATSRRNASLAAWDPGRARPAGTYRSEGGGRVPAAPATAARGTGRSASYTPSAAGGGRAAASYGGTRGYRPSTATTGRSGPSYPAGRYDRAPASRSGGPAYGSRGDVPARGAPGAYPVSPGVRSGGSPAPPSRGGSGRGEVPGAYGGGGGRGWGDGGGSRGGSPGGGSWGGGSGGGYPGGGFGGGARGGGGGMRGR